MEALHRQVLPFILRRLKEDVLHDLPPKIIQDYHCEMSSLQRKLYHHFTSQNQVNLSTTTNLIIVGYYQNEGQHPRFPGFTVFAQIV